MKKHLKKTKIDIIITELNDDKYLIEGDNSRSIGILHITHEFSLTFQKKDNEIIFLGGSEISADNIIYPTGKEGIDFLNFLHPDLFDDIKEIL